MQLPTGNGRPVGTLGDAVVYVRPSESLAVVVRRPPLV